jgi:hypothetical protein
MHYDNNSRKFKDSDKAERNVQKSKDAEKSAAKGKMESFEKMLHGKSKSKGRRG